MDQLSSETDLSHELPSYRSWLRSRPLIRALNTRLGHAPGRKRPTRWWNTPVRRRNALVAVGQVTQVIDLTKVEGNPTPRADPGLLRLGVEADLRGQLRVEIEAPAESAQGTAMTVVILLLTGAIVGAGGLAAGQVWGLPVAVSAAGVLVLFVSPVILFCWLRRHNQPASPPGSPSPQPGGRRPLSRIRPPGHRQADAGPVRRAPRGGRRGGGGAG
jgi:hypothetical protein